MALSFHWVIVRSSGGPLVLWGSHIDTLRGPDNPAPFVVSFIGFVRVGDD